MVVFGQNSFILEKVVVFGQSSCTQAKCLYSGKMAVLGKNVFLQGGCI